MLAVVAVALVATGLPAWLVLVGVSLVFASAGIAAGAFDASFVAAISPRLVGLVVNTQDVFHAALVPAGLFVLLCVLVVLWQGRRSRDVPADRPSRAQWLTAAIATVLLVVLLSGVALGYLYAVEAAATGGVVLVLHALAT